MNLPVILEWATDCLVAKGYSIQLPPEIILQTPWSKMARFLTSKGDVYLKQTPPSIALEPKIMQLLADQFHANVPIVIAINERLHGFLMKDAGKTLRQYLKTELQPDQTNLLRQAIQQFTTIQRSVENHIDAFILLGVPDWRLAKLPKLYNEIIQQTAFLKAEGMTDKELQILYNVIPTISEQCELLSEYHIPETLVQPDFNTNNILFDPNTQKMTLIDLGEIAITHPFFSLHNFLYQATIHHNVKEHEEVHQQLQDACCENWLALKTKDQLLQGFMLAKKLWPVYAALAHYRLLKSVDLQTLKSYGFNKLPTILRGYVASIKP